MLHNNNMLRIQIMYLNVIKYIILFGNIIKKKKLLYSIYEKNFQVTFKIKNVT